MTRVLSPAMVAAGISLVVALASACGGGGSDPPPPDAPPAIRVTLDVNAPPAERLSAYHLFTWSADGGFALSDRVVPYDVNTALFSDYALKERAIYIPDGAAAKYDPELPLDFPTGSAIIKTFYFPADLRAPTQNLRLVETRLLVRHEDGWQALPYVWDADQRDAVLTPTGGTPAISFIDADGAPQTSHYLIPQRNQCQECHTEIDRVTSKNVTVLVGVKTRHLNRSYDYGGSVGVRNQLDQLVELGMLTGAPAAADAPAAYDFAPVEAGGVAAIPEGKLDTAARDYLDINCAHCHNSHGINGVTSQLFLTHDEPDPFHLGVCKRPGSAGTGTGGFKFDIVPGDPDTSVLYFRTHTTLAGAMMPLLGRSLLHTRGAELLHAWIAAMPANNCMPRQ
ncbi:MAG: SO2930 family diheme c-type cytochrome [bacterium]